MDTSKEYPVTLNVSRTVTLMLSIDGLQAAMEGKGVRQPVHHVDGLRGEDAEDPTTVLFAMLTSIVDTRIGRYNLGRMAAEEVLWSLVDEYGSTDDETLSVERVDEAE